MKKAYSKPALYAEAFALVEHISACAHLNAATYGDPINCSFNLGAPAEGPIVFTDSNAGCIDLYDPKDVPGTGDLNESTGYCYNAFLDEGTLLMHSYTQHNQTDHAIRHGLFGCWLLDRKSVV